MLPQHEINQAEEYAATVVALNEGIESFYRGEGLPARQALADLASKYGLNIPAPFDAARKFPLHDAVLRSDDEAVED